MKTDLRSTAAGAVGIGPEAMDDAVALADQCKHVQVGTASACVDCIGAALEQLDRYHAEARAADEQLKDPAPSGEVDALLKEIRRELLRTEIRRSADPVLDLPASLQKASFVARLSQGIDELARLRAEAAAQTARVAELVAAVDAGSIEAARISGDLQREGHRHDCYVVMAAAKLSDALLHASMATGSATNKIASLEKQLAEVTREREEAREEILRLQDVAIASQQLFGVKVARVEPFGEFGGNKTTLIVTYPGGDEQKIANLVGEWLHGAIEKVAKGLSELDALRTRADKSEQERDEARADRYILCPSCGEALVDHGSGAGDGGGCPGGAEGVTAKWLYREWERTKVERDDWRMKAEAQLAAQAEHCKTLAEALRALRAALDADGVVVDLNAALALADAALSSAPAALKEHK